MGTILSDRQKDELHRSMLDYLANAGFTQSLEALKQEARIDSFEQDPKAKWSGLLEKKWTSVIRLQKKVMELEARNAQLQEELLTAPSKRPSATSQDWVPRAPARHTLASHRAPVTRVAFHPRFSVLASASEDASIKIWDWETGDFERTIKGHTKAVHDVDFDPQGNLLVSCSADLTLKLWDTANEWKNVRTLYGHDHSVSGARFLGATGDRIVSCSRDRTIRVWQVASGFCTHSIAAHDEWVRAAIPSLDGRFLASCSNDKTARVWDLSKVTAGASGASGSAEQKVELRGHDHIVEAVAWAPVASYAAIRELGGLPPASRSAAGRDAAAPAAQDGQFLASASRDNSIRIWDCTSGQCLRTLSGHDTWVRALAFHPNGKMLLSASDDKSVKIWDLKTGRCTKTLAEAHSHFVATLAWGRGPAPAPTNGAANGSEASGESAPINVIATGSYDSTVKVWLP